MQEKVGNVVLNYQWYPGKDLYSDGEIEDELLRIACTYNEDELNGVIAEKKNWAVLYHFSHIRKNIVNWLPIKKTESVLEIGSGCGAITGALSEKAGRVTCIELSKKRSLINANRNKSCDNIEILVGNFLDIESRLTDCYNYITLIGVFEYAEGYMKGKDPYLNMLKAIKRHLAPGGKIIIAIENRLGLKYWAGCAEDHCGDYFAGIEGYPSTKGVRTFSKQELETMFDRLGGLKATFYYPYPDYKFPMSIYSDEYLPKVGELVHNCNNFDRRRLQLFDESKAFDSLCESNLFPLFSNSYLIVLEK